VNKWITTGVILALLVTFMVPVAVGADDRCTYTPPECPELEFPAKTTRSLAGAMVWTTLAATDIMGTAVAQTTGMLACNLGGWSDELGVVAVEGVAVLLEGVGGLLPELADIIGLEGVLQAIGDLLITFAGLFRNFE